MLGRIAATLLLLVFSVALVQPNLTRANNQPSVEGECEISFEGVPTRRLSFGARTAQNGAITGEVTFQDKSPTNQLGTEESTQEAFYLKAEVNCLIVKENKVFLTSTVTESSAERYLGGVLIVVAVEGDNERNSSGRVTWGFYRKTDREWLATDFERSPDEVNPAAWLASDAERLDDEVKLMTPGKETAVTCTSSSLSELSFKEDYYAKGNVLVRR